MPDPILRGTHVVKRFGKRADTRPAVADVSVSVWTGQTLGIVGESGSGKSTLARCLALLEVPDEGQIVFAGLDMRVLRGRELRSVRRRIQIIFQDPFSSLNPRLTVGQTLEEVLTVHQIVPPARRRARTAELLDRVGLPASAAGRYPAAFSGGQRQRICLARALAAEPEVLIADEPVSALDVSIQAQILNLLRDLQQELGLAIFFVSHNLFVVQYMTDDIAIMFGGRIVEQLPGDTPLREARHPYTQALVAAAPRLAPASGPRVESRGGLSSTLPATGCPYRQRCPHAFAPCESIDPAALPVDSNPNHLVACHYVAMNTSSANSMVGASG